MTGVGVAFIALGLFLSFALAWRLKSSIYVALFLMHLAASFFYWNYSTERAIDAWGYYVYTDRTTGLRLSTALIGWLTVTLRDLFEASYVDMFMMYHLSGYIGMVAFCHLCSEAFASEYAASRSFRTLLIMVLFLPGLHVWTCAIGKDAPMFCGVTLVIWGLYRPSARMIAVISGLLICALIRPHIAACLAISTAMAAGMSKQVPLVWRAIIVAASGAAAVTAIPFILEFVGLQSTNSEDVVSYIERRQASNIGGSSIDISDYPFPLQFLTYMFRPLFFDANGAMALVVSCENLLYVSLFLLSLSGMARTLWSSEHPFFVRFNFAYWFIGTSLFALTTANLGLAARQKTMILPSYIVLTFAAYSSQRRRRSLSSYVPTPSISPNAELVGAKASSVG